MDRFKHKQHCCYRSFIKSCSKPFLYANAGGVLLSRPYNLNNPLFKPLPVLLQEQVQALTISG
jgi:hypothetical protein